MKKIVSVFVFAMIACSTADVQKATKQAEEFAKHMPEATGVTCNDSDSDGDGYVSCTVFRGDKDPLALSCGAQRFCSCNCASGCKLMAPALRVQK